MNIGVTRTKEERAIVPAIHSLVFSRLGFKNLNPSTNLFRHKRLLQTTDIYEIHDGSVVSLYMK